MSRPFIPCNLTARVETVFSLYGKTVENNYFFGDGGGWTSLPKLEELAFRMAQFWQDNLKHRFSTDIFLVKTIATNLSVDTGPQAVYTVTPPIAGTIASEALPANVAVCIKLSSTLLGRSRRGRLFFAGIPESKVTGNTFDPSWAGDLVADLLSLNDYIHGGAGLSGAAWAIASFRADGEWRDECLLSAVVEPVITDFIVDSQRRRLHSSD